MFRFRKTIGVLLLMLMAGGASVIAQEGSGNRQENPGFQVERAPLAQPGDTRFLTGPNSGKPLEIALSYVRQNGRRLGLTGADLVDLMVTDEYLSAHNGVTHIYIRQRLRGIEVAGADLNINIAPNGSIINMGHQFVSNLAAAANSQAPSRTAAQSVDSAARHLGLGTVRNLQVLESRGGPAHAVRFNSGGISLEDIPAKLVYQPVGPNAVRLAWQLDIAELDGSHWWSLVVDAESGAVLAQHDYVDHDVWPTPSRRTAAPAAVPAAPAALAAAAPAALTDGAAYNVYALPKESPSDGPRTLEVDPALPAASPFGWHDTNGVAGAEFTVTRGNNVHAYTDIDANNLPDPGSDPDGGPGLLFDFPLDLNQGPATYRPAAVVNLFYWNNIIHDVFYGYGFNEPAGNFQVNNYGKGGLGNDDVRAEAQDGSGLNNANFGTPVDGLRPRMQMFVWQPPGGFAVTVNGGPIAGSYLASSAQFGPSLRVSGPVTGDVALVNDGGGVSATDACEPLVGFPAGHIALLDRGTCTFVVKVKNAQNAGAIAAIVANNVAGAPITMGGADPTITIPSVMVSLADGNLLKANLPLNATLSFTGVPAPDRDSDLDNGVIVHEYGHGISNRLTGGPSVVNCLNNSEQMGEGWSDWLALVLTTDPADTPTTPRGIGTYLLFEPTSGRGIRPNPYTTDMAVNPTTYGNIGTLAIPHGVGYAWATMLWEVYWNLVNAHGYNADVYGNWTTGGNNLAIQLVMDGMKLQVCRPGFVDGRNAILQADMALTGGANQCYIWQGFAKRGLGFSANQGENTSTTDGTEAFDLPAACLAQIAVNPTSLSSTQIPNTQVPRELTIANQSGAGGTALNWSIAEAPVSCAAPADLPWVSVSPNSGTTSPTSSSDLIVTFDATGLPPATSYSGRLCISHNDPDTATVEIPLSLTVIFNFGGFYGPIANPPAVNLVQPVSVIPVIFSLDGNRGLNVFAAGYPVSQRVHCSTMAPMGAAQATSTPGASGLAYDAATDRYTYPWQTFNNWNSTCRRLTVRLVDGTEHVAFFEFRR